VTDSTHDAATTSGVSRAVTKPAQSQPQAEIGHSGRETLEDTLLEIRSALDYFGPLLSFPWHGQQVAALRAATNRIVVMGGNQSGKTQVGLGIVGRLVRREGPIYRRLRDADERALKIWISPQTSEKYKSNWEPRLLGQVYAGLDVDYVQAPQPVYRWHDAVTRRLSLAPNELWGKSQEQGFLSFESDVVDLVLFDEEPGDHRLDSSAVQRTATTNGVVVYTFTPLLGMTWTHGAFYVPTVREEHRVADRVWRRGNELTVVQMGMADNPASVAGGGVARLRADPAIAEAERQTRLYGVYGYTEGLIWPEFAGLVAA